MSKITIQGKEYFSPTNDVVFKTLFTNGGDYTFLFHLLNAFLSTKIEHVEDITIENSDLSAIHTTLKSHRLDLLVNTNNQLINIELQVVKHEYELERVLKYASRLIEIQVKKGYTYGMRKKVVVLWISDHSLSYLSDETPQFIYDFKYSDQSNSKIVIDLNEIILVDLTQIPKEMNEQSILWAKFLKVQREEELDILRQDHTLDQVIQVWEHMNNDKSLYDLFKSAEDMQEDYERSLISEREAGYHVGIEQGMEEGILQTAKKLKAANVAIDIIVLSTGLSEERIKLL